MLTQGDNKFRNKCGLIILNSLIGSSFDISRVRYFTDFTRDSLNLIDCRTQDFYSNELMEQLTAFAKVSLQ
jgi:hypothetical protein